MKIDGRLIPGQMFGRYQIVRVLGEGGMGIVYEAVHPALKKRFAIKTLLPSVAELPSVHARFLREGEATARIDHPHIVDIVDVGEHDGMPFLVMEFLEGETLADLLAAKRRLEVAEAVDLLLPVLSAVAAGHAQGVVHRDLKPANIFLARGPWGEPLPKVLDFGISKLIGDTQGAALTGTLTVLGTAAYMSPEQTRGVREIDGRSDQYSLGLILYEATTGRRAHDGDHALEVLHNIASGIFRPPREVRPDLPAGVEKILLRMLSLEAGGRYRSLLEVGRVLLPFASEKARVTLADAFPPEKTTGEARAATVAAPSRSVAARPADSTTFRHSAAEMRAPGAPPRPRPRRAPALALGVAAVLAAGGWAFTHRAPSPIAAPAPTAPAAVALPAPSPPPTPAPANDAPTVAPAAAAPAQAPSVPSPPATAPTMVQTAVAGAAKPSRRVHHKKPSLAVAPAASTARAVDEAPRRGANNALIIK
jgi:eukaryotic-like serine/threonine-protein kinase